MASLEVILGSDLPNENRPEFDRIRKGIKDNPNILSARIYGSFLIEGTVADADIAIMVPSNDGVCEPGLYQRLRDFRIDLSSETGLDVDLIPHTMDEVFEFVSPLYYPKTHPALVHGKDIKGRFPLERVPRNQRYTRADLAKHVLLDNRTVTRRQVLRPTTYQEARIFLAKLQHGPGNVLTLLALENGGEYYDNPSNFNESFRMFSELYQIDISPVLEWINSAKDELLLGAIEPEDVFPLLHWYEALVSTALYGTRALEKYTMEMVTLVRSAISLNF